eukprot:COSAG05_NODE_1123_length_5793_cov_4.158588_4_plen_136_part_00
MVFWYRYLRQVLPVVLDEIADWTSKARSHATNALAKLLYVAGDTVTQYRLHPTPPKPILFALSPIDEHELTVFCHIFPIIWKRFSHYFARKIVNYWCLPYVFDADHACLLRYSQEIVCFAVGTTGILGTSWGRCT